jgi:lysophospholipid acyltransferase (LPLAT)-like uncharacterized protein
VTTATAPSEPAWRASRSRRLQAAAVGAIGFPLIHAIGTTWQWRCEGREHLEGIVAGGRQPVMAFWHGRILPAIYYFRNRGIVVITSDNFDGEWIARIIHRFGFATVRGSTSRNAARAALKAKRQMEEGKPVGVTLDGPRGPALVAQPGAIWLAKATGNPVLPFHIEAARHWTAGSWDAAQVPRPFSLVAVVIGAPLWVPTDAGETVLEEKRLELERVLATLKARALTVLVDGPSPGGWSFGGAFGQS